jgi:hypothetical protein
MSHWTWRTCDCRGEYTKTGTCYLCGQEGCGECAQLSVYWGGPRSDKAYLTCGPCREEHGDFRCICGKVTIDGYMERYLAQQAAPMAAAAAASSSSSAAAAAEVTNAAEMVGSSGTLFPLCRDCLKHGDLPIVCEEALSNEEADLLICEGSVPLCHAIQRKCCASIVCKNCDQDHQTTLRDTSNALVASDTATATATTAIAPRSDPWEDSGTEEAAGVAGVPLNAPSCRICKDAPLCPVCASYHFVGRDPCGEHVCAECPAWKRQVATDLGLHLYEDVSRLVRGYVTEDPMKDWCESDPTCMQYHLPHSAPIPPPRSGRASGRGHKRASPDGDWTQKKKAKQKKKTTSSSSSSSAVASLFK